MVYCHAILIRESMKARKKKVSTIYDVKIQHYYLFNLTILRDKIF